MLQVQGKRSVVGRRLLLEFHRP